ncbi:hypothetical protein RBU89_002687 [Listeria monocytogenes]|nr:hypothetical protein [Listeria monocytogenes]
MREIEFRGKALISIEELDEIGIKHKNGYVYGDLADNSHIVTGILESNDEYICSETWCGIDSKTIGQYTGLKDKNGTEIFKDVGYYPSIDKALQAFVDYQIKTSEINSFEELASELNAIRELLVDIASKLEITIPSMEVSK